MKIKHLFIALLAFGITTKAQKNTKKVDKKIASSEITAEFNTTKGKIIVNLEFQKAPITVANFISLVEGTNKQVIGDKKGKPYYDGLKFHRVIKDFMIQGGCPLGTGSGDPGYKFKDEFDESLKHDKPGILSMANSGPTTNGSQFFITHKETPWLNGKHTVFGHVISGQDVVNAIAQDDVITSVKITRNGKLAKAFDAAKVFNNYFTNKDADALLMAEKAKAEKDKALIEFKTATTTASGLKYLITKQGTGEKPTATSNVKVHYTGMLINGKVFDSSVQRGEPISFGLNQVIPGWTEGVQLMNVGSKYKFYIPSNLAYGAREMGGVIPANSDLIFEVELLDINK